MEKIAIISDVHSNITAFKAVIEDIRKRDITRIFCAGDLVLKGSSPCEVLDLAKEKCEVIVRGNAEEGAMCGETPHKTWHRETLGKERMEFISQLPLYFDFYMSGSLIRMFHASKNDTHFRIMDFDNAEEKMKLFEDESGKVPDIVLYGDIHIQYMQKFFNKTIVNVGSVGNIVEYLHHDNTIEDMSESLQAYYTILEGEYDSREKSSLSINFVRVPYDIEKEIEIARKNNIPSLENYILELKTGMYRKNKKVKE
ncbi:MAG: metallophosphoesterase family protein [Clostridia bacterium]|nr:metallophosphoesterase family protein [Clostridia bacterium]